MKDSKNILIVVLIVLIICLVGALAFYLGKTGPVETPSVEKQISTNEALVAAFAAKLNKDPKNITVAISKEVPGFAQGGVKFADVEINSGANFFAAKVDGKWVIAWYGHGTYACEDLDKYYFPVEFKGACTKAPVPSAQANANNKNNLANAGIKQAFAAKYHENLNNITVTITQQSGDFYRGTVHFSNAEVNSSAMFLAMYAAGTYDLVVDGHGTYQCSLVLPLGFPQNMVSDCSR